MPHLRKIIADDYRLFKRSQTYAYLKTFPGLRTLKQSFSRLNRKVFPYSFRLHGDPILQQMFVRLCKDLGVTSIIETGTFRGSSTSFMAENMPDVPIFTGEINPDYYKVARKNLKRFSNVRTYNANSPNFLQALFSQKLQGSRPLFFLDAHWEGYWPLEDEMRLITEHCKEAIIVIDDFRVPFDNRFTYDKYGPKECSLELIAPYMNKKNTYKVLFPNYGQEAFAQSSFYPDLVGYPVIFQNMNSQMKKFEETAFVKKFFVDRTDVLKKLL